MAEVRWEGQACECCLCMVSNGDESGCRDYWGHTHRSASLDARTERQLDETYPQFADSGIPWSAWLCVDSSALGDYADGWCDLCGEQSGELGSVIIVR